MAQPQGTVEMVMVVVTEGTAVVTGDSGGDRGDSGDDGDGDDGGDGDDDRGDSGDDGGTVVTTNSSTVLTGGQCYVKDSTY